MGVGEALAAYLRRTGLRTRLDQASVVAEWAGLVGYRLLGWTRELFPAPPTGPG